MTRIYTNPVDPASGKRRRGRPSLKDVEAREKNKLQSHYIETDTNETTEQRVSRIEKRFRVMYNLCNGVIQGFIRSLIVSGAPGVGKTYTINRMLDAAHEKNIIRYKFIGGAQVTGVNLYKLLYEMREKDCVLLMDDSDSLYDDELSLNLLKAALDTGDRRKLSWLSESNALKKEGQEIPTSFDYSGAMIFITNKDFQYIIDSDRSELARHIAALQTRSNYLDLQLHRQKDLLAWTTHMVRSHHILVQHGLTRDQEETVIAWCQKHYEQFRVLSIREYMKIGTYMLADPDHWEIYAESIILRS